MQQRFFDRGIIRRSMHRSEDLVAEFSTTRRRENRCGEHALDLSEVAEVDRRTVCDPGLQTRGKPRQGFGLVGVWRDETADVAVVEDDRDRAELGCRDLRRPPCERLGVLAPGENADDGDVVLTLDFVGRVSEARTDFAAVAAQAWQGSPVVAHQFLATEVDCLFHRVDFVGRTCGHVSLKAGEIDDLAAVIVCFFVCHNT